MKLDIYSKDGQLKLTVAPDSNNAESLGIQEESILALSFTGFACIPLEVYDYTEFQGRRYWVTERYVPQMNARREWAYSIRLSGVEGLTAQVLMVNPDDEDNPLLTLLAPAREHAALIVANLNRKMGTTDWKVGEVVVSEYIDIEYTGKYASDALSELSEAAGTEWWFDGMTLNISRCEFGEYIPLSYGNGLTGGISRSVADGVKFFTRLFPVGSSRNIDPDDYGHARLQLPDGSRYVEQDTHLGIVEHYEQAAFEEIFPRRVGQVGTVRHEEKTGEEGKPFTIWYFTDPALPFDPNQYEIGGLVKRVTFQSGELRGREFEVNYDADNKEFEIITQWPYDDDLQLPSEPLVPASGDEYVLWNIRMPESYYPAAEQEFREAVDEFMAANRKDISVFQAPTDFTVIERRALDLRPGQRIRLESAEVFPDTGFRETRIVSISRSVIRPGSMTLKMSDVLSTGRISRIESGLVSVERLTKQVASEFPDIIRSWEETPASDTTLYSSRKSEREFLNKRRGGTVEENVVFEKQISVGDALLSKDFRPGDFSGAGFGAYRDENGNAVLEADVVRVRKEAVFNETAINQTTFRIGSTVFSLGGCEITRVEELEETYRCYYDNKEGARYAGLVVDDQVRCQQYDPQQQSVIRYYWRLIVAVGDDYVDLSKTDADGSGIPQPGDEIAQFGNRTDALRQRAIVINPQNGSVEVYAHVDSYTLSEKNFVGMGVDPLTGESYLYAHENLFFGDRHPDDDDSTWITFQKEGDDERRKLRIKADVTFGAGSGGLSDLQEWKDLTVKISDFDYLKEVFPNNVVDNNGVFLSQLMAVKNGTETGSAVVAGLYGGGVESLNNAGFKDPEHGILMWFAGADNVQSVASARTRVYGDGSLFTDHLFAEGGKIGGFTIGDIWLENTFESEGVSSATYLSGASIQLRNTKGDDRVDFAVMAYPSIGNMDPFAAAYISNVYKGSDTSRSTVALQLSASGSNAGSSGILGGDPKGSFAIYALKGAFAGLRPVVRQITGSVTLSAMDHTIVVTSQASSITIRLVANPENGQQYYIYKSSASTISISGNGKNITRAGISTQPSQGLVSNYYGMAVLIYSSEVNSWIMGLFNN